jgi:hypothetical protein
MTAGALGKVIQLTNPSSVADLFGPERCGA